MLEYKGMYRYLLIERCWAKHRVRVVITTGLIRTYFLRFRGVVTCYFKFSFRHILITTFNNLMSLININKIFLLELFFKLVWKISI